MYWYCRNIRLEGRDKLQNKIKHPKTHSRFVLHTFRIQK
jgi:hypothetical protein